MSSEAQAEEVRLYERLEELDGLNFHLDFKVKLT